MNIIMNPYAWLAVAAWTLAVFGVGYWNGHSSGMKTGMERLAEYRQKVQTATAEANRVNERRLAEAQQATKEVADGYAQTIVAMRGGYKSRIDRLLDDARSRGQGVPALPATTEGADARPADLGPGSACQPAAEAELILGACRTLERQCADATAQLLWLQDWTARQNE